MKVAVVQDWLLVNGGAEKVLKEILNCYPEADVFSLIDFMPNDHRKEILQNKNATTSWLQKLPGIKSWYRNLLPFFPKAIESLNLEGYDLIISSSYCVAKGVPRKKNKQIHVCYCHSPIRYVWDLNEQYLNEMGSLKKMVFKFFMNYIKRWDLKTVANVDFFIANSQFVQERIQRIYNRDSAVIYPPVDLSFFSYNKEERLDYYFTSCRLVGYKKVDLIVQAFNKLPKLKLVVGGDGPEFEKLKAIAHQNISFKGYLSKAEYLETMQNAKAFVLAAEEDFGITSLEAQACGTPVIALKKGGYLESVLEGETGVFFPDQTDVSLIETLIKFNKNPLKLNKDTVTEHLEKFKKESFTAQFKKYVSAKI